MNSEQTLDTVKRFLQYEPHACMEKDELELTSFSISIIRDVCAKFVRESNSMVPGALGGQKPGSSPIGLLFPKSLVTEVQSREGASLRVEDDNIGTPLHALCKHISFHENPDDFIPVWQFDDTNSITKLLFRYGISVNLFIQLVDALCEVGDANVNQRDEDGNTAWDYLRRRILGLDLSLCRINLTMTPVQLSSHNISRIESVLLLE
jgi:hypothetical protein